MRMRPICKIKLRCRKVFWSATASPCAFSCVKADHTCNVDV